MPFFRRKSNALCAFFILSPILSCIPYERPTYVRGGTVIKAGEKITICNILGSINESLFERKNYNILEIELYEYESTYPKTNAIKIWNLLWIPSSIDPTATEQLTDCLILGDPLKNMVYYTKLTKKFNPTSAYELIINIEGYNHDESDKVNFYFFSHF